MGDIFAVNDETGDRLIFKDGQWQKYVPVAEDMARGGASGLKEGALQTGGMIGDVRDLLGKGIDYAADKTGVKLPFSGQDFMKYTTPTGLFPTSGELHAGIDPLTKGLDYDPTTEAGSLTKGAASFIPAALAGPGGWLRNLGVGALAGATSQGAGDAAEATGHPAAVPYAKIGGALFGTSIPNLLAKGITRYPAVAGRIPMAQTAEAAGVPLTAGQYTGNKALLAREGKYIGGSGVPEDFQPEAQARNSTRAMMNTMGQDTDVGYTPNIKRGADELSNQYKALTSRYSIPMNNQLWSNISQHEQNYLNIERPSQISPKIEKTVNDIADMATRNNGVISGEDYQRLRSTIGEAINQEKGSDAGRALGNIRDELDNAMGQVLQGTPDEGAWQRLGEQWKNMRALDRTSQQAGATTAGGTLKPGSVYQNTKDEGQLARLARSLELTTQPHPTPKISLGNWAKLVGMGVTGALGAHLYGGPEAAVSAIAGETAIPAIAHLLRNNPIYRKALFSGPVQAYFRNQIMPGRMDNNALMTRLLMGSPASVPAQIQGSQQ